MRFIKILYSLLGNKEKVIECLSQAKHFAEFAVISNPQNPARTTPAGPPIPVESLQQIGRNIAEFHVFFGNQNAFEETLNKVYSNVVTTS